jgi:hypothetical protein
MSQIAQPSGFAVNGFFRNPVTSITACNVGMNVMSGHVVMLRTECSILDRTIQRS